MYDQALRRLHRHPFLRKHILLCFFALLSLRLELGVLGVVAVASGSRSISTCMSWSSSSGLSVGFSSLLSSSPFVLVLVVVFVYFWNWRKDWKNS